MLKGTMLSGALELGHCSQTARADRALRIARIDWWQQRG
jgi:hypothetical protein